MNIINRTPFGCPVQCSRATLPENQLYQAPIFDGRPDSNVHRCIGVFDDLLLANRKLEELMNRTYSKRSNYIIKSVNVNASYDYNWSNSDEDEIDS